MQDMYCDGASERQMSPFPVSIYISMVIDVYGHVRVRHLQQCYNVRNQWFEILCSSPLYDVAAGSANAFFATWPLTNQFLGAENIVAETMTWARYSERLSSLSS